MPNTKLSNHLRSLGSAVAKKKGKHRSSMDERLGIDTETFSQLPGDFLHLPCAYSQVRNKPPQAYSPVLVFFALLGGRLPVGMRRCKDARSLLHQVGYHGQVVARSCAVQRRPGEKQRKEI